MPWQTAESNTERELPVSTQIVPPPACAIRDPAVHGRPWCLGVRWNRHDESPHVSGHSAGSGAMLRTLVMPAKSASATSTRRTAVCQRAFVGVGVERAVHRSCRVGARRGAGRDRRTVSRGGGTSTADPRTARRRRTRTGDEAPVRGLRRGHRHERRGDHADVR